MEGNDELQKKAQPGEMAIKGTRQPDVTTEPVAPIAKTERTLSAEEALRLKLGDHGPDGPDED